MQGAGAAKKPRVRRDDVLLVRHPVEARIPSQIQGQVEPALRIVEQILLLLTDQPEAAAAYLGWPEQIVKVGLVEITGEAPVPIMRLQPRVKPISERQRRIGRKGQCRRYAGLEAHYWDWSLSGYFNKADFYDLF